MTLYKYGRFLGESSIKLLAPPFTEKKWSRICLPADYANDKLPSWNQKYAKTTGNPWKAAVGFETSALGKIAQTLINSGVSVVLHPGLDYSALVAGVENPIGNASQFNWSLDKTNKKFSFIIYLDSDHNAVQWAVVELFIPDMLANIVENLVFYSWDGSAWQKFMAVNYDPLQCGGFTADKLYYLDGENSETKFGAGVWAGVYEKGERGETKSLVGSCFNGASPTNITYSSYYGCKKRVAFTIRLPADDGNDSATTGASQCKLKIEVYYGDESSQPGGVTYEFENSSNQYYGLTNINKQYSVLFKDNGAGVIDFLQRESGVTINSLSFKVNHDEEIYEVTIGFSGVTDSKKMFWGQSDSDPGTDSDADGIPDILDGSISSTISIESFVDGGGWS